MCVKAVLLEGGDMMTDADARTYGESAVVYEEVLAGEPWPKGFWADTIRSRRITEILTYVIKGILKIECYEEAKKVVNAAFIDEYELSKLVEMAERPPEMQDGEFFYLLWYVFPEERIPQDELTIKVYDEVLTGKRRVFPRGYFVKCGDVERKARICFKHLCEDVLKLDRKGICRIFCNSNGIKVLQKYKLKIVLDIVYESLFHLVNATYPEYISDLEKYMYDRRLQSVKMKEASGHAD